MDRVEKIIIENIKKMPLQYKYCFFSALITGLLSHGYMFVNNLSYHDAIRVSNGLGTTFSSGRWALGILDEIGTRTIGIYGIPLFNGVLSILLIAISGMLIISGLKIKGTINAIYIGVIMASFPVVTSTFAYMYTASAYFLALFLCVSAAVLIMKKQNAINLCLSIMLLAFSLGIYQAYFSIAVTLMIMSLIIDILDEKDIEWRRIVYKGGFYFVVLAGGMGAYLCLNSIIMKVGNIKASAYQGMESMAKLDMEMIPKLIKNTYYFFLHDTGWSGVNSFGFMKGVVAGISLISVVLLVRFFFEKGDIINKVLLMLLLLVFPIGINIVYIMSAEDEFSVHTLMRYSLVLFFVVPVLLLERISLLPRCKIDKFTISGMGVGLTFLLWIASFCYIYLDNVAYLKVDFLQEQAMSWYTTLITEIKSTEGYKDEMPICYIGERKATDLSLTEMPYFEEIMIDGYDQNLENMINDYVWTVFMRRHCGYYPEEISDKTEYEQMEEVINMSNYPDKGSIQVIKDTVVVKFAE